MAIETIVIDGEKLFYDTSDPTTALLPFIARLFNRINDLESRIYVVEDRTGRMNED